MARIATATTLLLVGTLVASCGVARDVSDTASALRDMAAGEADPDTSLPDVTDGDAGPEWSDFPEEQRFCGATWTRDEMMAAYEEHGLDGLPQRVGFSGSFLNEIDEFHNRWRITRVIAADRERREEAGLEPRPLITCIAGTASADDPRDAFGVNVVYINDHTEPIHTPTLTGVEVLLTIRDDDTIEDDTGPHAAMRWVGECPRRVTLPTGGGYAMVRCDIDGPRGLASSHVDVPDGLPEDCPDADFTCAGLAYFPSRDAFTEILADPDINYNASSSSYTRWYYPD